MRLGATLVHLADAPPYPVAPWARRLVEAGFESLWTPHIVGRGPLVPDPFVTLAVAASVTSDVELGTATVQVPLLHPAELAFRVRSLQLVAGSRLTLGVSPGSTKIDYVTLDHAFTTRFDTFHGNVARLRSLLGGDAPAMLLGSWGKNVERAAREYDGWIASGVRTTPDEIVEAHARYRDAGGGRAMVCAIPVGADTDLSALAGDLHRYADAGFDDVIVLFQPGAPDPAEVRALLP